MEINIAYIWLLAGVISIVIEALGLSGVGFIFAGLGALVAGTIVSAGMIAPEAYVSQWLVFFLATLIAAALLWKPIQRLKASKHKGYSNIVGDTAYVGSNGLTKCAGGEVTWSGTIMKAQLAKSVDIELLEAGSQVVITDISGATLIVKPKE